MNRRIPLALLATAALGLGAVAQAVEVPNPEGPLTKVEISETLNCAVDYQGDREGEFFWDTACGTLLAAGGELYGPSHIPAGSGAHNTAWTPVSQVKSGSGTSADPFTITTVVSGGSMKVTEVDTYVKGANSYNTTVTVTNVGSAAADAVLYHGADCYLQDDDYGWGEYDAAKRSVLCRAKDKQGEHSARGRIEEFIPTTADSNYFYAYYGDMWAQIGTKQPLPDKLQGADDRQDNGMALSWSLHLAAGESQSYSMITNFSPLGEVALPSKIQATADSAGGNQYLVTASIKNPNTKELDSKSTTVVLPKGGSYVDGSVQGVGAPTIKKIDGDKTELVFPTFKLAGNGAETAFTFKVTSTVSQDAELALKAETVQGVPVVGSTTTIAAPAQTQTPKPSPTAPATPTMAPTPSSTPTSAPTLTAAPTTMAPALSSRPGVVASRAPKVKPAKKGLASTGANLGIGAAALGAVSVGGALLLRRRRKA